MHLISVEEDKDLKSSENTVVEFFFVSRILVYLIRLLEVQTIGPEA